MAGALGNLTVIDCGHHIAGPYCASLLAGLGALVIKIEKPETGDPVRQAGPFPGGKYGINKGGLFNYLNLGKKSLSLNLKTPKGREIFRKLAGRADLIIENYEPRVMPSLGLSYPELESINRRLIMLSISNFGQTGPYRDYQGFEITLNALGGVQWEVGEPDREPLKLGGQQLQYQAGLIGAYAVMTAVSYRHVASLGQHIDLSIQEVAATLKGAPTTYYQFSGKTRYRNGLRPIDNLGGRHPGNYPIAILPCKDGWVCIDSEAEHQWRSLCDLIGRPELKDDPGFHRSKRGDIADKIDSMLIEYIKDKTPKEVFDELTAWRVPVGIVHDMKSLYFDEQHRSRGFFTAVDHPEIGEIEYPGHIFLMSETPWKNQRAPLLGEHNREILHEWLGYHQDEIAALACEGII